MAPDTLQLPASAPDGVWPPPPGGYALDPDRCVIEVASRILGVTIRERLTPLGGELVIKDVLGRSTTRVDAAGTPIRWLAPPPVRPVARRWWPGGDARIRLETEKLGRVDGGRFRIYGTVSAGDRSLPVTFDMRVVAHDQGHVLLVGRAALRLRAILPARGAPIRRLICGRHLRLLIAGEFG